MKRRLVFLIIFIITSFTLFIVIRFFPKDYTYYYQYKDILITEEYNKDSQVYYFTFELNNNKYYYDFNHKYINKRGLVEKIEHNDKCISPSSDIFSFFSVCIKDDEYVLNLSEISAKKKDSYEKIDIYDLNNHKYFVWNYRNFIIIDNDETRKLELFKKDVYKLDMATVINNHLLVADYNQKHQFDTMYLLNFKNDKIITIDLEKKLYFDGYILGTYKDDVYVYDVSSEKEYRLNPFKKTIKKVSTGIYNNGKWEGISTNKLNKKNIYFEKNEAFSLENKKLLFNNYNSKILVTPDEVKNIIYQNSTEVYYIMGDTLYYASIYGENKKIMKYSEWKYNSDNIYIY